MNNDLGLPSKDFEVTSDADRARMVITCLHCTQRWFWPANKPLSIGAHLDLLNHSGSHIPEEKRKGVSPMSEEEVVDITPEKSMPGTVLLAEILNCLVEPCRRCRGAREKLAECWQMLKQGHIIAKGEEDCVGRVIVAEEITYHCPLCKDREVVLTPLGRRLAAILNVLGKDEADITGKSEPVDF